jgi:hypothetical protein
LEARDDSLYTTHDSIERIDRRSGRNIGKALQLNLYFGEFLDTLLVLLLQLSEELANRHTAPADNA